MVPAAAPRMATVPSVDGGAYAGTALVEQPPSPIQVVLAPDEAAVSVSMEPLRSTLRRFSELTGRTLGCEPELTTNAAERADDVRAPARWQPAAALLDAADPLFDELVAMVCHQYDARRHTAAALLWKQYNYWNVFPVTLGWLLGQRVPLTRIENAYLTTRPTSPRLLVAAGRLQVGALIGDRAAGSAAESSTPPEPAAHVIASTEDGLLSAIASELVEGHLAPAIEVFAERTKVSERVLWGSVAEAVAQPILTYGHLISDLTPDQLRGRAERLLTGLGRSLGELVEFTEPTAEHPAGGIQRRTCCLAFTCGLALCRSCCVRG